MSFSQLKGKKVLITGINGFIGSHLTRGFVAQNAVVHGTIRATSNLNRLDGVQPILHVVDLEDRDQTAQVLKSIRPDFIIHTAEPSGNQLDGDADFKKQSAVTTKVVTNLLESARLIPLSKIIQCCSSALYGAQNQSPFSEDQELLPDSARGLIKLNERNIFRSYAHQYKLPVVLARIFRAYGPHDHPYKLILKAWHASNVGSPINVSSDRYMRDFVYVDDLVEGILLMCITDTEPGEEINIGSGKQYCAADVIELINEITGVRVPVSETSYKANAFDKLSYQADITKAKRVLGWTPKTSIAEGLRRTIEWAQRYSNAS